LYLALVVGFQVQRAEEASQCKRRSRSITARGAVNSPGASNSDRS
jgi:hypothetical protein